MTCPCGRLPDPGVCPDAHDRMPAGGHCRCAHPGYVEPDCGCQFNRSMGLMTFCADHWEGLQRELESEPRVVRALANLAQRYARNST